MKGKEIIEKARSLMLRASEDEDRGAIEMYNIGAHTQLLDLHARALASHCECLGMNAENMWAAIANSKPVYTQEDYLAMMKKWGLIDKMNEPII